MSALNKPTHNCYEYIADRYHKSREKTVHYLLSYTYVDDFLEKRAPFREEHLKLAEEAYKGGALTMAGACTELPYGATLLFKGEDPSGAEEFVKNDPYVKNGLVVDWKIRPLKVVFGG